MSDTRRTIADHVRAHPGIHFNELVRALDLAPGQVQYHLKKLRARGTLVAEAFHGRTHYYPPEYDEWERHALALVRRETAGDIVAYLLDEGPSRPAAVADDLDIARSTLEWHLDRLVDHDLVSKRRGADHRVTLAVARPVALVDLLDEADSTLHDTLVDRFERLVDRLLE